MNVLNCCALVAFCINCVSPTNLPSFINPCSESDPNVNECFKKAIATAGPYFADGIPELGVAPLDPVELGTVQVDNPSLKIIFTDTVVSGLRGFKVNSYNINTEKGKAVLDFTSNVTLKAHYVMDGRIIILPIRGNGEAKIKITNLNIVVKYDFETKGGHWKITGYKDHYKMDHAQFKFSNLFGGNKQLSETTQRFANESWEAIMQEVAPPAIDQIIKSCVAEVNKFFGAMPAAELLRP